MLRIAIVLAVGYGLVVATLWAMQRSLIYRPDKIVPEIRTVAGLDDLAGAVEVSTADGLDLLAWYFPPQKDRPVVLYFHGNAGSIADRVWRALALNGAGYGVMLLEYRGYGGNPGKPSEAGLYADGRGAVDWLVSRGIDTGRIVFFGESLGTGVATQMALEYPDAFGVVLESPFTSMAAMARRLYPWVPVGPLLKDRFDNLSRIAGVDRPVLILHGEQDDLVPVAHGRRLLEAAGANADSVFFASGRHSDLWDHGAANAVTAWLARHGAAESAPAPADPPDRTSLPETPRPAGRDR